MGTIRSFMFHDIRNLEDTNYPKRYSLKSFLNKKQFQFQIEIIRNNYKVISSKDVKNIDIKNDNSDYAVLTFDDGLMDHYSVYKHLKSLNISGTFLIPKLPVEEGKAMNTHKIQFILASADEKLLKEEILGLFNKNRDKIWNEYSTTNWKNNWWSKEMIFITNFLRKYKDQNINNFQITNHLFEKYVTKDELNFSKDLYLDYEKIDEMSNSGMIIGGHGYISENLLLVDDYKLEIDESKKFVSKYSDKFIFSYPNGGYDDRIKKYMSDVNCQLSFTVNPFTITELDEIDYLEFPRYDSPQKIKLP
jgi:peptidoglycan/xylan/chitin deacetylase (PgdA/CDA1 family)